MAKRGDLRRYVVLQGDAERLGAIKSSFEVIRVDLNWICGELERLEALSGVLGRFRAIYDELTKIV